MGTSTGLGSLSTQTSVLQMKEDRLMQQIRSPKSLIDDARIDKGAQQFEAILMGSWLKEAEQSFGSVPGGDDDHDAGGEQMMSLGIQSLATSLAASGGIGIAKMVATAMHAAADKSTGQASAMPASSQIAGLKSLQKK